METENVYFSWMFGGDSVFYSNSPLIEVSVLNDVGEYILYLNLTTPGKNCSDLYIIRHFSPIFFVVIINE